MKTIEKLILRSAQWYQRQGLFVRSLLWALGVSIPFYLSNLLSAYVAVWLGLDAYQFLINSTGIILLITVLMSVRRYVTLVLERFQSRQERLFPLFRSLGRRFEDLTGERLSELWGVLQTLRARPLSDLNSLLIPIVAPPDPRRNVMEDLYQHVTAYAGAHFTDGANIDFEVCLFEKATDGHLTITASRNHDHRTPPSLLLRRENPEIYDKTEAWKLYSQPDPKIRVVEDTKRDRSYAALYGGELDRIRSSVIYPVKNHDSSLVAALVVHCNKPNFFRLSDREEWEELLECFAKLSAVAITSADISTLIKARQKV